MIESYRGKPRFAGGCQIPPAALDVQDIQRFAQNVYFAQLDRGISATVQYQRRVASEQLGAIDTQPEFAWMPRGILAVPQSDHRHLSGWMVWLLAARSASVFGTCRRRPRYRLLPLTGRLQAKCAGSSGGLAPGTTTARERIGPIPGALAAAIPPPHGSVTYSPTSFGSGRDTGLAAGKSTRRGCVYANHPPAESSLSPTPAPAWSAPQRRRARPARQ